MSEMIAAAPQLILASASPRRLELLTSIGIQVVVSPADVDETPLTGESPEDYVVRLALAKAKAGAAGATKEYARLPVLGADTVVVLGDQLLGKPRGKADGIAMLLRLSDRSHEVLTAVAVRRLMPGGELFEAQVLSVTRVTFRTITQEEAEKYWDTQEPRDKAGAYGIQGIGGIFAERIEGSFTGVMGLPIAATEMLLRRVGVQTWQHRIHR